MKKLVLLLLFNLTFTINGVFSVFVNDCSAVNKLLGESDNYDCCTHNGITCENGFVAVINLSNGLYGGSIPPELGNLTRLVYLDLSDQGYHGSLPSELGNLSNLQYIYLSNNAFTGSIPSEFGNLLKLEILSLRDNLLSGFIPPELGRLNLEYLDIRNNGFSGSIPQEILNNNISKFFHDNYNDKNKQVVEKEEKNDLNKDAKSDNGTNPFLIIAIVFGIISIILTILIFLVLRKNRDLKKKNNERNSFSTLNKVHINSTSISGNGESSTNLPDIPLNSVNESNYIKSLNHTNNNNTIIGGEEDLLPSYEDILNENGEHNTGNMHDSTSNFIKE